MTSPMEPPGRASLSPLLTETADPTTDRIARAAQKLQDDDGSPHLARLLFAVIRATWPGYPDAVDAINGAKVHAYNLAAEILDDGISFSDGTSGSITADYCVAQADEQLKRVATGSNPDDCIRVAKLYLEMACVIQQGAAR